jgi:2-succinyl-5-enolpyruvyl-6-hydroxy-3-cyclohexene-1-carboxylate synthase
VVLLIGDLDLLHDLGGLLAAHTQGLDLTIVVLDNDGGGIFSFLPIAAQGEAVDFERLFRTPHGLQLGRAAELFGLAHVRVEKADALSQALQAAFAEGAGGTRLIEVPVDRDANVAHFRELAAHAAGLAAQAGAGAS